ncbi:unnamed protein product [Onchocerca flexuosa]|uniref:Uncharacterized protein n=1 Tax=Onchocerca flexuosa TaxID=387005 RepID=A0A183H3M9_9BILA|nr:unnamed protein product [Onchocerca flexuosa]
MTSMGTEPCPPWTGHPPFALIVYNQFELRRSMTGICHFLRFNQSPASHCLLFQASSTAVCLNLAIHFVSFYSITFEN